MRVLFSATAGDGHVRPMLPLLQAMARRGHAVGWAGAAETHALVQAHGSAVCFDAGPSRERARFLLVGRWPALSDLQSAESRPLLFPRLFGAVIAPLMLRGLRHAIAAFAPDLVIGETAALAVPLAAQLAGCPHVTHGFGMPLLAHRLQAAASEVNPLWLRRAGMPAPCDAGLYRHLYLDICPSGLQRDPLPAGLPSLALQPHRASAAAAGGLLGGVPGWFHDRADLPLVYLSLGTVLNRPDLLRTTLMALTGLPVRVLATTGPNVDPTQLLPLPPLVHATRYLPQAELLPHCSLVISHGGSGTLLAALAHGLPQLVLPQMADQFINATALSHAGAGLALMGAEQSLHAIREAVRCLLAATSFRDASSRLAQQVAAMPSADEVVVELERGVEQGFAAVARRAAAHSPVYAASENPATDFAMRASA